MQQKILRRTVKSWIRDKIVPFPLVRIASLINERPIENLSKYISLIDGIAPNTKENYLRLPLFFDDLLSDNTIYFYGYLMGDGCISKERLIKLCDGHPNPAYLEYSLKFFQLIQQYIKNKFNLPSKITQRGNKFELVLTSKFLSRFFKFFYNFKKDEGRITKPKIIKDNKEKSCIFYRGLFDADAGIKVKDKFLAFKCIDEEFLKLCKKDFEVYGVKTSEIDHDDRGTPFLKVYSHNLLAYAKNIGFNHPRKKEDLIAHLRKGCLIKKLGCVNHTNIINNQYYDLSKIAELRVRGVSSNFKEYRQRLGTQEHVAKLIGTFRENIKRWENDIDSIPFDYYIKLMKLHGFSLVNVFEDLSKRNVLFGKGRLKQFIRLPLLFSNTHFDLFQYLNPTTNKTIVKSYGIDNRKLSRQTLFNKIEKFFGVKVLKDAHSYVVFSVLISDFLKIFYKYNNTWDPLSEKETYKLREKWEVLS